MGGNVSTAHQRAKLLLNKSMADSFFWKILKATCAHRLSKGTSLNTMIQNKIIICKFLLISFFLIFIKSIKRLKMIT